MNPTLGILIPFLGTTLGSALVFFMKKEICPAVERSLLGFAAGIMTAASIWSLLLPAVSRSSALGKLAFLPAAVGFSVGIVFFLIMDRILDHYLTGDIQSQNLKKNIVNKRTSMLLLSVTLHNIPEGLAVGVAFAGAIAAGNGAFSKAGGDGTVTLAEAAVLAVGIAVQNIPEGAIISMPLKGTGFSKRRSFLWGALSGAVEPLFAVLTLLLAGMVEKLLPFLLSFAAGAMVLVVVEELLPEAESGPSKTIGTLGFSLGFLLMMILDVALG